MVLEGAGNGSAVGVARRAELPRGARLGALVGCTAWAVLLTGVILAEGRPWLALELGGTATALSLGVGLGLTLLLDLALRAGVTQRDPSWRHLVGGGTALAMAALLLLWSAWLHPRLAAETQVIETMVTAGSATAVPAWVSGLLALVGVALLGLAARAIAASDRRS